MLALEGVGGVPKRRGETIRRELRILGENLVLRRATRCELEQIRRTLPGSNLALGPTTMAAVQAFRDDDRELWARSAELMA